MASAVFFLKAFPGQSIKNLPWPGDVRLIGIDPPAGMLCGGADRLCSSAYSRMAQWLEDSDGRILPNFLAHYARGIDLERVAFVGFSAAHGFLNPLGRHPEDRAGISAIVLMDATFGGGKTGYAEFGKNAVNGDLMLATATSNTGGDDAWQAVVDRIVSETGEEPEQTEARTPMPEPSGGVWQIGKSLYWYRFVDERGGTEMPHYRMGEILPKFLEATLIPYWKGELGGFRWGLAAGLAIAAAGGYTAWRIARGA